MRRLRFTRVDRLAGRSNLTREAYLRDNGYRVNTIGNATEAIRMLQRE